LTFSTSNNGSDTGRINGSNGYSDIDTSYERRMMDERGHGNK
jgi:hypothetical protein